MDVLALLGHPAVVAAIVVAIVAGALVLIRRRRRATPPPPVETVPAALLPEAAYLDSSHILEGPIVGDAARPDSPRGG